MNPNILFFDCSFAMAEESPEVYEEICSGLSDVQLSCYPNENLIKARKSYFDSIKRYSEEHNFRYSEERIFQNELHRTLTHVFETGFSDYFDEPAEKNMI